MIKRLLFLVSSIVLSLALVYFAYFARMESLILVTNVTIIVLLTLNVLANIFQLISFTQSLFIPKSIESINYKLGSEILTPLYIDVKKVKSHLEEFNPKQMNLELWRKKKDEYLFLTMRRELRESINNFYENVEKYNTFLERFKVYVRDMISSRLYDYCEGIIVPPVNEETGEGFDSKFNKFCIETTRKICDEVITIVLKRESVSSLQPSDLGVLESPLFNLLRIDDGFAFSVKSEDPEVIEEKAAKYSEKFAKSVFESIFKEDSLREIKDRREKLIGEAEKLVSRMDSEIRRTS
jgi:hypothetical protein